MVRSQLSPEGDGLRGVISIQIVERLAALEAKLEALIAMTGSQQEAEWIDRKAACALLGVSDRHLRDLIAAGTIYGNAVRNVGTPRKARYRFHRTLLLNQYHRRV